MNPTRPNTCSALFLVIWPCLANAQDLGWVERIGGSFLDRAAMATDATGNIYLAGNLNDEVDFDPGPAVHSLTEAGMGDLFIAKYDPSGNYLWAERIGGAGLETVRALAVAGNGDLFISGGYSFTTDFDPGPGLSILSVVGGDEGYLAKYDTDGVLQWVNGIIGEGYFDLFTNLRLFNSGDVLITGAFIGPLDFDPGAGTAELTSAPSTAVGFMARYAGSTGALVWAGALDDPDGDMIRSAAIDAQGDIYVAGEFSGTMDADPSPALAPITVNDDILFVMQDIFFAKYDGNGSFVWVERIGGPDSEGAAAIQLDGSGHLYVTGQGAPLMDMDPGPDTVALSASVFIAKYDNMGEYEWAYAYEGYEGAPSLRVDPVSGSLVVNGAFSIPVDLDLGPTTFILDPYGNLVAFSNK